MATTPVVNTKFDLPLTNPAKVVEDKKKDDFDKDTFLKLLVAQLKYQDPLKPTDPQAFLAQSAQFTQVEKLAEMADAMKASTTTQGLTTASALIGRTVSYAEGEKTAHGKVTGASIDADGVRLKFSETKDIALDQVTEIAT